MRVLSPRTLICEMPKQPTGSLTLLAEHVAPLKLGTSYVSTFSTALRDARVVSGRDEETGAELNKPVVARFAGVVVYFVLLEQIGKSLRPEGARRRLARETELERAVRQSAPNKASKRERQVLYALRCAFAHEYGLLNKGRPAGSRTYCTVFRLDDDPAGN